MADQITADRLARAWKKIQNACREARPGQNFGQQRSHHGRQIGRFEDDAIAGDDRGRYHSGRNRQRKVPRGYGQAHPARLIRVQIPLAGVVPQPLRNGQPNHLTGVIAEEIDRLRDVGIRLSPGLADLIYFPCRHLITPIRHFLCGLKEYGGPILRKDPAPDRVGLQGGLNGPIRLALSGIVHLTDQFPGVGWIDGSDLLRAPDLLSPNHHRDRGAQPLADLRQGLIHCASDIGPGEIGRRLVDKLFFLFLPGLHTSRTGRGQHLLDRKVLQKILPDK